ncbi:hypothetical protein Sjap_016511 [Stephania japonica]|uniref:Polysaccharide biosynthesis domain-containing protein n=1 Tax=Stephania japonica TaxID=461633 RepID=A0AAP0NTI8_9MAGN
MMKVRHILPEKLWFLAVALGGLIAGALLILTFTNTTTTQNTSTILCSLGSTYVTRASSLAATARASTPIQLQSILHYATSRIVPQQSLSEIRVSFDVLHSHSPCNFLVFGLGHDSLMWASFNSLGTTLFLEEDPKWVQTVLKDAPDLRAHHVNYRTRLDEADTLIKSYKTIPECLPEKATVEGNVKCKLALVDMPKEVYEREWDLIMIDAPKGYFDAAPGRMGAIFSAAVLARRRKGQGLTHVFLHDVDRKVERMFAEEFLCRKYLVKAVGRLWHFEIPPLLNVTADVGATSFC